MPQAEKSPDRNGFLTRGYEPSGHEINGRDVICIQRVPQPQRIRQQGRRSEGRMIMQDHSHGGPDDQIDKDKKQDDGDGGEGEEADLRWETRCEGVHPLWTMGEFPSHVERK